MPQESFRARLCCTPTLAASGTTRWSAGALGRAQDITP